MYVYRELEQDLAQMDVTKINGKPSVLKDIEDFLDIPINHCKDFFIVVADWRSSSITAYYNKAEVGQLISDLQEIYDNMNDDVIDPKESSSLREYYDDELPWEYNDDEF